jgi:hypothetical protein
VTKRTRDNNGLTDSENNDHKLFFLPFLCVIFSLVRWPVARWRVLNGRSQCVGGGLAADSLSL